MHEAEPGGKRADRGYEDSEVSAGRLLAFAGGVVALIVLGAALSAFVFHFFVARQPLGPPASPFENVRELPPEPRLQTNAPRDLKNYEVAQEKLLGSYGWVDPQAGVVRIPIERAMELSLAKGYPVRAQSTGVPVGWASNPGGGSGTLPRANERDARAPASAPEEGKP